MHLVFEWFLLHFPHKRVMQYAQTLMYSEREHVSAVKTYIQVFHQELYHPDNLPIWSKSLGGWSEVERSGFLCSSSDPLKKRGAVQRRTARGKSVRCEGQRGCRCVPHRWRSPTGHEQTPTEKVYPLKDVKWFMWEENTTSTAKGQLCTCYVHKRQKWKILGHVPSGP